MRAIIVATGRAPRLLPLTKDTPTSLLPVGGKPILARQAECLRAAGIDDIWVVAGPHTDQVEEFSQEHGIKALYNPFYLYSDVVLSLWLLKRDLTEPFILLYNDILFGDDVVVGLLEQRSEVCLTVKRGSVDSEAEKVVVENGFVHVIGKDPVLTQGAYGEFIGVARFGEEALPDLYAALDWMARQNLEARFTHLIRFLIKGGTQVSAYDIGDSSWIDIDFPKDIEMAEHLFG